MFYIYFSADGTGWIHAEFLGASDEIDFTWSAENGVLTMDGDESGTYSIVDNTLTIDDGYDVMTFQRVS